LATLALAVALTGFGAGLIWPPASSAFVACSHSGGTLTANVTDEDEALQLTRFGEQIAVVAGGEFGEGGGVLIACSGSTPTMTNTDLVAVEGSVQEDQLVVLDLATGPLGPGATPEADGTSEIEVRLNMPGPDSYVLLEGSAGTDTMTLGVTAGGSSGINANAGAEPAGRGDADVELVGAALPYLRTFGGDDVISGIGGDGFTGPLPIAFGVLAGPGRDVLTAGSGGGLLAGRGGRDLLLGSNAPDGLYPGKGKDTVLASGGRDYVLSIGDRTDRVRCGPGRDRLVSDRKDHRKGCERVRHEAPEYED
jgi:hypothetical protein